MIIVLSNAATGAELDSVLDEVHKLGATPITSRSEDRKVVGLAGGELSLADRQRVARLPGVSDTVSTDSPYPLVSRRHHSAGSTVWVSGVPVGGNHQTLIAGPCAVESEAQTFAAAGLAKRAGASILRGGCFKPRSSPYSFQGLGVEALKILREAGRRVGLPTVTEVVHPADVGVVSEYSDMLQIGARNAQNFALLHEAGLSDKPVLLKRGMSSTVQEWLLSAEYIANAGNLRIVLCERGIRTFEPSTRNTLDVSAVAIAASETHLPVVVDPSHSGGRRDLVITLGRAGLAAGASGLIVDVHPDPSQARCDGPQALTDADVGELAKMIQAMAGVMGRKRSVLVDSRIDTQVSPVPGRIY